MDKLPSWVTRVQAIWIAVGSFLALLATQGLGVPDILVGVFSEEIWSAFVFALGAVIDFYQVVRALFASKSEAGVEVLSNKSKAYYALNPFKLHAA